MEKGVTEADVDQGSHQAAATAQAQAQAPAQTGICLEVFFHNPDQVEDGEGDDKQDEEDEAGHNYFIESFLSEPDGEENPDPREEDQGYQSPKDLVYFRPTPAGASQQKVGKG